MAYSANVRAPVPFSSTKNVYLLGHYWLEHEWSICHLLPLPQLKPCGFRREDDDCDSSPWPTETSMCVSPESSPLDTAHVFALSVITQLIQ